MIDADSMDGACRLEDRMTLAEQGHQDQSRRRPVVLLVEDEIMIRMADAESLREAGISVIEAGNGAEGLAVLESAAVLDALITDINMPGELDGLQLAALCRDLRPGLPILLASARLPEAGDPRADRMLAKPYAFSELLSAVKEMMGNAWQTMKDRRTS
ncbi:response regulator [Novosphingobium flavum]|uniref:Response regulator n=1 Tax=Novosphingobium flavum TaxID=1778672 RepID=A0A7X1KMB7_9SPHN|nr:response regulator [Novosphingobium flavum]MBC2666208.1 response regulator [Novosphingobium flavum]